MSAAAAGARLHHAELGCVHQVPGFHAARTPDLTAVVCAGDTLTYAGLHRASSRLARALTAAGVGRGARVAYLGQESTAYYVTLFACAAAGAVLVPVNFRLSAAEVTHIVTDSGAALLVVDDDLTPVIAPARAAVPDLQVVGSADLDRFADARADGDPAIDPDADPAIGPDADPDPGTGPDDPVAQLYTSGTTGLPKGVVLAHRSFFAIRDALAAADLDWIDFRSGDRSMIGIPGFHVGGLWWAMQGFAAGVTNVAMPRFDATAALGLVRELAVSTLCVVPSMLRALLDEPGADAAAFASVRKLVYGGSPIAESLLARALPVLDCDFAQIYGLTETGNTAVCLPPADHRPGSPRLRAAGRPYPGVEVEIIDRDGAAVAVGEIGEVCLRTPARMLGYWNLPEATAATLVDGWVRTGDAGRVDADGYVVLSDRLKDMIIVGGENVYPAEVENVLTRHPDVADAAVIGVPDDATGEAVHAVVAPRPGARLRPRDLLLFCRDQIAGFKVPSRFEVVEDIPRNPSGKILRRALRERFWTAHDRRVN